MKRREYRGGRWKWRWALLGVVAGWALNGFGEEAPVRIALDEGSRVVEYEIAFDQVFLPMGESDQNPEPRLLPLTLETLSLDALEKSVRQIQRQTGGRPVELVVYETGQPRSENSRRTITAEARAEMKNPLLTDPVVRQLGFTGWRKTETPPYVIVTAENPVALVRKLDELRRHPEVVSAEPMARRPLKKYLVPNDRYFGDQWNLLNPAPGGIDINVTPVWDAYTGGGVVIGICDDGVQIQHPDLSRNGRMDLSYDFIRDALHADAYLTDTDIHGTAVAGIAAAIGNNSIGVAGVAFRSQLASLRLISGGGATDDVEAACLSYRPGDINIYNCSWGPVSWFQGPRPLAASALQRMAEQRRRVFVFAAGNDAPAGRMANYNGYANSVYTIAVGAVDRTGRRAVYSERGANLVVCAPAGVPTTDRTGTRGYNTRDDDDDDDDDDLPGAYNNAYFDNFPGTSAAAPHVAGVVALMRSVNPSLSWRDVQEILMETARRNTDPGWVTNAAGLQFHLDYGAGIVDANAAVTAARGRRLLGLQNRYDLSHTPRAAIPDADATGYTESFVIPGRGRVEHVVVTVRVAHDRLADLEIDVVSPSGTRSPLLLRGANWLNPTLDWSFMTVWNWGESSAGTWSVVVRDTAAGTVGTLESVALRVYVGPGGGPSLPPPPFSGEIRSPTRRPDLPGVRGPDRDPGAVPSPEDPGRTPGGGSDRSPGRSPTNPGIRSPTRRP